MTPRPSFWEGVASHQPSAQDLEAAGHRAPPRLPDGFAWCRVDLRDPELLRLLEAHYVDGDDGRLRMSVTPEMLEWTLHVPRALPGHAGMVGVRVEATGRLVACITCTPLRVRIDGQQQSMGLINYMCVHGKLRNKRLTPVLVKEITRVGWANGLASGISTSSRRLHAPLVHARYHQRVLNMDVLVRSGFLPAWLAPAVAPPPALADLGTCFRPMCEEDVGWVGDLLCRRAARHRVSQDWSGADEVRHYLLPRGNTVYTYVDEDARRMVSLYVVPVKVMATGAVVRMAHAYTHASADEHEDSLEWMSQALVALARRASADVLDVLDVAEWAGDDAAFVLRRLGFFSGADVFFHAAHCPWAPADVPPGDSCLVLP